MRSAGNFHPEWGYLAPAPSFMRSVRIALVATAIGATAGAVVVVSLMDRPGANDDNSSIAAHALVTTSAPVVAAPAAAALPPGKATATAQAATPAKSRPAQGAQETSAASDEFRPGLKTALDPVIAANASKADTAPAASPPPHASEALAADGAPPAEAVPIIATDTTAANSAGKRHHEGYLARRRWQAASNGKKHPRGNNHGFASLFHFFGSPFDN